MTQRMRAFGAERSAAPGLVSVPTRAKRTWIDHDGVEHEATPIGRSGFRVKAETAQLHKLLDAFGIDTEARRLAQLRMNVGFAARAHCIEPSKGGDDCLMLTLTYAGTNEQWEPRHIKRFMDHIRSWMKKRGWRCRYVWVAELQQRGVIHYHVALWVPKGTKLPKPDEAGWWPHGMTRIEVARAAVPYLFKYLSKDTSKTFGRFPRGARIYGIGGAEFCARRARRWLRLPSFVQANSSIFDKWERRVGGGWTSPAGAAIPSEFRRVHIGANPALIRVHRHPRLLEANGPFCWLSDMGRAVQ